MKVTVVGAGFIGGTVVSALRRRGHAVWVADAPRYTTGARDVDGLLAEAAGVDDLEWLHDSDVVVNCAGMAAPTQGLTDELVGANALLPAVLAAGIARGRAGVRLIHVSSAAVQGWGILDETPRVSPWSAYSQSKAWGEQVLSRSAIPVTIYRPASVHGPGRPLTISLARFAASAFSCVAGSGNGRSPVSHVANVADGITFVAECPDFPEIVLHPSDGLSCAELLRVLGGREPRRIPRVVARTAVRMLALLGGRSSTPAALSRRLEVTWFGQEDRAEWLRSAGWTPIATSDEWRALGGRELEVPT